MAKVKITGHASGSGVLTITAPNTSTDRTITLPDATATIATTTDVAARLPSITDGGNSTAITIDSSEQVGIGIAPSDHTLSIKSVDGTANVLELASGDSQTKLNFSRSGAPTAYIRMYEDGSSGTGALYLGTGTSHNPADILKITSDGRGLSQFTAKMWVNFNGTGTVAIRDSHNVASIGDHGTGKHEVVPTNAFANVNGSLTSGISDNVDGGSPYSHRVLETYIATTSRIDIVSATEGGTLADSAMIAVTLFGD